MSVRLTLALDSGDLQLSGVTSVVLPTPDHDLSALPKSAEVVQPFKPFHDHFVSQGFECVPETKAPCDTAIVFLPRAKAQARAAVAAACQRCSGLVVIDGAKTDGIDSILKELRKRVEIFGPMSKAHGKIFWFQSAPEIVADWVALSEQTVDGFHTAPGVFSADGIDPASALLIDALPQKLGTRVADLGAGWGFLAARLLQDPKIESVDLVEADHAALTCAQTNITDDRARFHWADALTWQPKEQFNTVVMNPPFHTSRAAEPTLGQGFIQTAARILTTSGTLWLVANRHLPYETVLGQHFASVQETAGDNRFKVLRAQRPTRKRR